MQDDMCAETFGGIWLVSIATTFFCLRAVFGTVNCCVDVAEQLKHAKPQHGLHRCFSFCCGGLRSKHVSVPTLCFRNCFRF